MGCGNVIGIKEGLGFGPTTWKYIEKTNTKTAKFLASEYNSVENFITETRKYDYENKRNGLTHLIIDSYTKDEILKKIINDKSKYSYLERIELDFKNNTNEIIVYKINFEKFDEIKKLG